MKQSTMAKRTALAATNKMVFDPNTNTYHEIPPENMKNITTTGDTHDLTHAVVAEKGRNKEVETADGGRVAVYHYAGREVTIVNYCSYFGSITATFTRELVLGDYQLGKLVGKGSFGKVYSAAHNNKLSEKVAVKLFSKANYRWHSACMELLQEVKLLMSLNHVNVLRCIEFVHEDERFGIVTPLCHLNLFQFCAEHVWWTGVNLPWMFFRNGAAGIFSGLDYLHHHDIAHLDIKPENVLVRAKPTMDELDWRDFVICDLGMCQRGEKRGGAIIPKKRCGTAGFAAPELFDQPRTFDGRHADMFSAGVTLMDVLSGRWDGWKDAYNVMKRDAKKGVAMLNGEFRMLPEWVGKAGDLEFQDLVCSLVTPNPTMRPTAKRALGHAFVRKCWSWDTENL